MAEIKVEMLPIEAIKPYDNNPRRNDKAIDGVAESIRQFGFRVPIIVDRDMTIVCGHTRRLAALKLGLREVPVYVANDMTSEQVAAFRLVDNRVSELAEWDEKLLKEELAAIKGIDLEGLGFDKSLLDEVNMNEIGVKKHICPRCGAEWTS